MKKIFKLTLIGLLFLTVAACKNNNLNTNTQLKLVEGDWIADGTQYKYIVGMNGDTVISTDNLTPFYLNFDGKGKYTLQLKDYTESGTYTVDDAKRVILISEEGLLSESCLLKNDSELHCDRYASLYIKI